MGLRSQGLTDPGAPVSLQRGRPGEGEHPTRVLFLHGLASSPTTWADLIPLMDPSCELWFADLPWGGAGRSAWWRRPPADWVGQAIDGIPGGVDLVVAHSFGANALLSWADAFGARTAGFTEGDGRPRGLVLVSPFYRSEEHEFGWDSISYYLNHFDLILQEGVRARSGGRVPEELQHDIALKVRDRIGCQGWMRFFDTYLATPRLRVDLLSFPCLIIGGSDDLSAFPSDAHALGRDLPDARVVLFSKAGHFSMIEHSEEFASALNEMIREVCDVVESER